MIDAEIQLGHISYNNHGILFATGEGNAQEIRDVNVAHISVAQVRGRAGVSWHVHRHGSVLGLELFGTCSGTDAPQGWLVYWQFRWRGCVAGPDLGW